MRPILTVMSAMMMALLPQVGASEEGPWTPMSGAEIQGALAGRVLDYASAHQDFRASGRTRYVAGRESWGYWRVEGDSYCSQWPPSDLWACYTMTRRGDALRFIGAAGDITEGRLRD